jgi:nitrate/TMAO reductase-like tetraheme cytochrome c subunit
MAAREITGTPTGCEACHSTKEWKDLTRFSHDATRFPLLGSHRGVACADCHKPPNLELTMRHVEFTKTPEACAKCHENPHADQFGANAQKCESCHNSNKWRPSLFDHEKTGFALKGGHENVSCSACHALKKEVSGLDVLYYKPTPKNCEACHSSGIPKGKGSST